MISVAVAGLVLAACGSSASKSAAPGSSGPAPRSLTTVSFNEYQGTAYTWLLVLAQAEGFFSRNGINATLVPTSGAPPAFAALGGGSLQFASGDMINGGTLLDRGTPLKIVAGLMRANQSMLVASASAHLPTSWPGDIKALVGKPVGVVSPGSAFYYYANMILQAGGLNPNQVNYASTTAIPANIVAALGSGRVAAAMVPLAGAYGLVNTDHDVVLFDQDSVTASLFPGHVTTPNDLPVSSPLRQVSNLVHQYLWASSSYITAHPTVVHEVQLALEETDVWLHNPNNLPKAVTYLMTHNEVTKFPGQTATQVRRFLTVDLPLLVSYVPSSNVATYQKVWNAAGVLPKVLPLSQFIASGVPGSASAVVAQVKAAGQGSLGSSA
ncbi:MAG: ABC transporter substrate-binding protein [Actinomycetota bacterium]|jgi:ABC-type nitrate/sulfonate/bicarbonate transport system substrate-binding protein|nr:ABC transporter substrate-binding protein [Actinomycetota bacterium]